MTKPEKRVYLSPPEVGEEERRLLLDAFDSNWIAPLGPHVDGFERDMCERLGAGHAAALSSGTAGLHLALILLGVERGDEVLCSSLTFSAPANAITYCGASPVFIDSSPETWNIDPELVEEELATASRQGKLPKAVIAVDLYGQCADFDRLREACARYEVPIIEDAAEALGATYKGRHAGTFGDLSVLSFNGNKIITTSGGGMLLSERKDWIDRARQLASQAREPAPHYQHSTIGYNYRLSNLLAAVGRAQLRRLEDKVARRRAINRFYREALGRAAGVELLPEAPYGRSNCWLTCVTIDPDELGVGREDLRLRLEARNIESRPVWKPMHLQPAFRGCRFRGPGVADILFERGLCLPSGGCLTEDQLMLIASVFSQPCRAHG